MEEQLFLENKKTARPFSKSAEIKCRMCSEPLERVIVDFAADIPFEKASQKIEEHHGVKIPTSTIRKVTQKHARRMSQVENKKIKETEAFCITGSTDGVMVPKVLLVQFMLQLSDQQMMPEICSTSV